MNPTCDDVEVLGLILRGAVSVLGLSKGSKDRCRTPFLFARTLATSKSVLYRKRSLLAQQMHLRFYCNLPLSGYHSGWLYAVMLLECPSCNQDAHKRGQAKRVDMSGLERWLSGQGCDMVRKRWPGLGLEPSEPRGCQRCFGRRNAQND